MISKTMIKFWCNFQIQTLYKFYWRTEKVTKIKLVAAMVNFFDRSHHLFTLHFFGHYFVFLWLRFKHAEGSLTYQIFSKKQIVQEQLHDAWKIKSHFITILLNLAVHQLLNENLYLHSFFHFWKFCPSSFKN